MKKKENILTPPPPPKKIHCLRNVSNQNSASSDRFH